MEKTNWSEMFLAEKVDNLNHLVIHNADGPELELANNSIASETVEVVFKNIKSRLVQEIAHAQAVVGCVAWLTDHDIVRALSNPRASIVVQKEDFLRPDVGGMSKKRLRDGYAAIGGLERFNVPGVLHCMSSSADSTIEGVRCCGNHNSEKSPAHPRMHNKFVVFCDIAKMTGKSVEFDGQETLVARAVWTGSFNFSATAGRSFENAVIIRDPIIANAYLNEWSQIAALSEPLNWESRWCAPEWRVGT